MGKPFGELVTESPPDVVAESDEPKIGLTWRVSDAARKEIEEIETNARTAEHMSGAVIIR